MFLDKSSNLVVSSMRSVWDSHEEILGSSTISLSVVNVGYGVDENDAKMAFECFVAKLKGVETLGDFLFQIRWLFTVFLDYLISSIEHVCFN